MSTINISLPVKMYHDAKAAVNLRGYASISEFIRDALRDVLYPSITENGFTPEFEEEVLRAAKEADEGNVVQWNGKGSFTDFVMKHPPKAHGTHRVHRRLSNGSQKVS